MKNILSALLICLTSPLALALEVGAEAPKCEIQQFSDAAPVQLIKPGKVTYVDFWASWCGPCEQSMPFLEEINTELKAKNFEVIAINLDESRDDASNFLQKHKVTFTVATNPDGQCPAAFGVIAMPSSYIVDRKGKIRKINLGFHAEEKATLRAEIEKLLAE